MSTIPEWEYSGEASSIDMALHVQAALDRAVRHLARVEEDAVKQGLVELGWLPPNVLAEARSLLNVQGQGRWGSPVYGDGRRDLAQEILVIFDRKDTL